MHKVKRRANGSNTFGRGWRLISPTPPPPKIAGFGGIWPAAAKAMRLAAHCTGVRRKSGRVGEEGGLRGPRYCPCRTSLPGVTGLLSCQCMWCDRGATSLPRQRSCGAALHRAPAWQPCRSTCSGATEANRHASCSGTIKWAMGRK
jgi:hypothetical protein